MTKQTYQGSCHCGAVAFEAKIDFNEGTTRCNCSICTKSRFWFAIVPPEDFKVERGEGQLSDYAWIPPGKSESHIRYRFCKTCGVRTFAEGNEGKFYASTPTKRTIVDPGRIWWVDISSKQCSSVFSHGLGRHRLFTGSRKAAAR